MSALRMRKRLGLVFKFRLKFRLGGSVPVVFSSKERFLPFRLARTNSAGGKQANYF